MNLETVSDMEIGLSLGANLGDRLAQLQAAKKRIIAARAWSFVAQSPVYETEPVGVAAEDVGLFFLNAVLIIESFLPLPGLLAGLKRIERQVGRINQPKPNAPRPIDIDIIYADRLRFNRRDVIIPHPRWSERRFVVQPLCDVRPALVIPGQTDTVAAILRKLSDEHGVKLFRREW